MNLEVNKELEMVKCVVCKKAKATAWVHKKRICQRCWNIWKYGNMANYIKKMNENRLRREKRRLEKEMKGGKLKYGIIYNEEAEEIGESY